MLFTPLPCAEIVLRALVNKNWFDQESKRVRPDAFILHRTRDKDGLSVCIQSRADLGAWLGSFKKSFGADSLHTGRIRTLGLDVGQSEQDLCDQPDHAVITGLPSPDEDAKRAESLASQLAKMSWPVDRTVRKKTNA